MSIIYDDLGEWIREYYEDADCTIEKNERWNFGSWPVADNVEKRTLLPACTSQIGG